MDNKTNLIEDNWEIVQHNWHETSINAKENQKRICKLDTEDWDVDEDNQYELESVQLKVARLIAAAPNMLSFLKQLQTNVNQGNLTLTQETVDNLHEVINKATQDSI